VKFSFDADKRAATFEKRGIDMLDAAKVFAGPTATWLDDRFNYGEARWLTAGFSPAGSCWSPGPNAAHPAA